MTRESGYIDGKQTQTYGVWAGMKNRCLNPKNKDFGRYGGRGITVYSPDNCCWATRKEQRLRSVRPTAG